MPKTRMLKSGAAMLGIATAPMGAAHGKVLMVGVVERSGIIEGVLTTKVTRDGTDSTARIARMVSSSRFGQQIKSIAIDGISVAGLNVVDIRLLERKLGVLCIVITRGKPRQPLMRRALELYGERHGVDVSKRIGLLGAALPKPITVNGINLLTKVQGVHSRDMMVKRAFNAIRLAHLIASGVSRKESKGRI